MLVSGVRCLMGGCTFNWVFYMILCSTNEDFGRLKQMIDDFRLIFQWFVAQIEYSPLKRASKISISSFVHPSKIFVWEAYNVANCGVAV